MVFNRAMCCFTQNDEPDPESQVQTQTRNEEPQQSHGSEGFLSNFHLRSNDEPAEAPAPAQQSQQNLKSSSSWFLGCMDYFDGVHTFSAQELKEHPSLKQRLIEEVNQQITVRMEITEDIYNCYFMTLIKKQADGQWLPVSFPSFFCRHRLGGWPAWTFLLQCGCLTFAVITSLPELPLPKMTWINWMLLVMLMSMNKYVMNVSFIDLTIVSMKRKWLISMKQRTPHAYDWFTPDRSRALRFILMLKAFLMVTMYLAFAMVLLSKNESLEFLKNCAGLGFILKQAKVGFNLLKAHDKRRQLGYKGALYVGVAEFNMEVELEAQGRYGKRPGCLWWCMNFLDICFILLTLSRMPVLHEHTWARVF
eukprot:TRINITY_DN58417_c0_g1_i1.p1 TRINITY_DN58417_c0_g1~~TRINITY_DN58417_c0_g1_i1.p1  ORF type:complete len:364 (-),score=68.56 TRINITY_DN58417_c0_g1_i1:107-1198(-)